ncbi:MAG: methyltransferase domain-containing protein [Solirubrobacterales bacterium]|nr:methyltransferase domain-containing protein [Solirubrobacterales bacterium]
MTGDPVAHKERQREMWALGDYSAVARHFEAAAAELVAACAVAPGDRILDVAAGNGNVALAAAAAGAEVVASDLTPALIELGRARTQAAGAAVQWVEADAEALPFADASFDVVTSVFGLIFAPRPEIAIAEAFGVARPGGVVGLTAWTPEGATGRFRRTIGAHLPATEDPPPDPSLWGDEPTARARLAPHTADVEVVRGNVRWVFPSLPGAREEIESSVGALVAARALLEPQAYVAMIDELEALVRELNVATDGSVAYDSEYLRIVARRPR